MLNLLRKKDIALPCRIPALLMLVLAASLSWLTARSQGLSREANSSLALHWLDLLNRHDTVAIAAVYTTEATLSSPNWEGVRTGQDAVREIYRRYFTSTPDLAFSLTNLIATDSAVVIAYVSRGALLNPEGDTPDYMKGKKYQLQNCTRLDIRRGKIIRQVNYFDQVAFLRPVGLLSTWGNNTSARHLLYNIYNIADQLHGPAPFSKPHGMLLAILGL